MLQLELRIHCASGYEMINTDVARIDRAKLLTTITAEYYVFTVHICRVIPSTACLFRALV